LNVGLKSLKIKSNLREISLTSRQKQLLKSPDWKDFITIFNEVHNTPRLSTKVGIVSIKIK
jgi:hypothetical protein